MIVILDKRIYLWPRGDLAISRLRRVLEQNEQPSEESGYLLTCTQIAERFSDYLVCMSFFALLGPGERLLGAGFVNLASASNAQSIACLASSMYFFASSMGSVTSCSLFAGISDLHGNTSIWPETL
jgi:hypothetical protein